MAWDPSTYLAFDDLRTRPAADLLARVRMESSQHVYDLGCGPGNSTALLRARWPDAHITGVDNSPEMLDRARRNGPQADWLEADLTSFVPEAPADVLFSNAAYHWVPEHDRIFPALMNGLNPGGMLAVQMPANFDAPSHRTIREVAAGGPWAEQVREIDRGTPILSLEAYYGMLAPHASYLDLWTTEYLQPLTGEDPVLNWVKGTALTPYLAKLKGTGLSDAFLQACADGLRAAYPALASGVTLFPFRRIFLVAGR